MNLTIRLAAVLLAAAGAAGAQADSSAWITHYNGVDGWFEFQGPERAMELDPADFGLVTPLAVESLKIWFYWGMGSFDDSVYTFRIYADDGATLLWESESLTAPRTYWVYYGLPEPVVIDSGKFYIVATARSVNPYAHPYINIDDDSDPIHCFFGSAGSWTQCSFGNYCFYAFVREIGTGTGEGRWTGLGPASSGPTVVRGALRLAGSRSAVMVDRSGRRVMTLVPGLNDVSALRPGVYLLRQAAGGRASKVVLTR